MTIVADSGPILSFARANQLELLHQVINDLTIPDAIYEEIVIRGAGKPGSTEVQGASWIRRLSVRDHTFVDQLPQNSTWENARRLRWPKNWERPSSLMNGKPGKKRSAKPPARPAPQPSTSAGGLPCSISTE
jgi:hypothetical protein